MADKVLTPAELTFESFRHSQGVELAQLAIFGYMNQHHRIQPEFPCGAAERARYGAHISSSLLQKHIIRKPARDRQHIDAYVQRTFTRLVNYIRHTEPLDSDELILNFGCTILNSETQLFRGTGTWAAPDSDDSQADRRIRRLRSPRASYLYFHGRDQHATGYAEFDQLYADTWEWLQSGPETKHLRRTHDSLQVALEAHSSAYRAARLALGASIE